VNSSLASLSLPIAPPASELVYDDQVRARTEPLYERVRDVIPAVEWPLHAPLIDAINRLKVERNAVILAHNYMTPEIFNCIGDIQGDSLKLAREAARTEQAVIVQAGVHFMAETAKILSPDKIVLMPDLAAGCSLAESITGEDVRRIRQAYPDYPIITYVNTSAEVKAEADICCTSSNAVPVAEAIARAWGVDTVIFIPDQYLARNVASQTDLTVLTWKGECEVHEKFTRADIEQLRTEHPDALIITHPECPPEVVQASDFAGSTGAMIDQVSRVRPREAILITECSMSDNVAVAHPETRFIRPCNLCPHMKRITLARIYDALREMKYQVEVDPEIARRARLSLNAMLDLPMPAGPPAFDPARAERPAEFVGI
jgi:quinolinate synthase